MHRNGSVESQKGKKGCGYICARGVIPREIGTIIINASDLEMEPKRAQQQSPSVSIVGASAMVKNVSY